MANVDKQQVLIGGIILIGAVFLARHLHLSGQAATTTDPVTGAALTPASFASVPTLGQGASQVVPGTDIQIGGSPAYLSYNYPAFYGPASSQDQSGSQNGAQACGGCCSGCGDDCAQQQWTFNQLLANYQPPVENWASNLARTRLPNLPRIAATNAPYGG
jgi:hypothetical protein